MCTTDQASPSPISLDWIRKQEKAELHVHLLGAIRPGTALELANKNKVPFPIKRETDWLPYFSRGDLSNFVEGFISLFEIIKTRDDFHRVVLEAAEDWARDGITYSEPRVTATSHLSRGFDRETLRSLLGSAKAESRARFGIEIAWVIDFPRILGIRTGWQALEFASASMEEGVVGFDIAGYEGAYGENREWRELFLEAKKRGLKTTAHSGEVGSSAHVRTAVEEWKVDRIGHGVRAIEDIELMDLLAEKGIPIEINPSCNVLLGSVPSLPEHPLEEFRRRGIPIILNTDDPSLFGVTLSEEIDKTALTFGWDRETTLRVIENGWKYRFQPT